MAQEPPVGAVNPMRARLRNMGMAGLIFGATFLAYLPAVHGGFLWDDEGHVTKPELQSFHGLVRIWGEVGATQQYYPLLHSAFWVEHRLWGDSLVGYHLMNLLLHAGAACLVVAIMRRLALPGAGLAGLLFALHPVCVESVAWISEQKNTLSAVFYLGAMLAYLHFDRDRRRSHYYLALGLFLLALLSKTVTATLPAALLVIFCWQRTRLDWRRDVLPLAPWLLLGACGGLFSAWMERTIIGAGGAEFALTPVQRGLVAGRAICFYLGKLAWPADLMFIYPRWNVNPAVGWQYLFPLAVLVLLAALGWVARRRRGPLAAFLLFVGTLFPSLGFLNVYPFVFSYVADHFQYLACLGILAPVASMLTAATARLPTATRRAIPILGGVLLTMLAVLTWRQSTQYGDAETLFRETLARNPACWMAHNNLGNILAKIPGRLPEAMAHYESALQTRPDFAEAHFNLANALAETPEHRPEAIVHYEAALRGKPDYPEAHNNLGETLAKIAERRPQAIAQFEAALRINPEFAEAHNNLGVALSSAPDRRPQAIAQFEAALWARPDFAEAHFNLANLLAKTPDRLPEAIAQYEAALRGKPDFAEAHFNLGWVLLRMPDRQQDGLAHFEAALRIQPDLAPAREMLDRLRAIQR